MKNFLKNWKTSLAGIMALVSVGVSAYQDPSLLTKPETIGMIVGGFGLIVAKDGDMTGTVETPAKPVKKPVVKKVQ